MRRGVAHWIAFFLSLAAVLSVAVAIQAFSEVWSHRFDLTLQGRLSLSENSRSVLDRLKAPLQIDYYHRRGERLRARDLLERIARESPYVRYELIDIDRHPLRAKQNGVERFDRAVLLYEGREMVTPAATEEALVGGIARILDPRRPVLYWLTDHGERSAGVGRDDQLGRAAGFLRAEGYRLRPLSLLRASRVPEDAAVVVVPGPEADLAPRELALLGSYLDQGGAILFLLDPVELPRLERWLASRGLTLSDDVVIEGSGRVYGSDGTNVIVPYFRGSHEAVRGLESPALLARARTVQTSDGGFGAADAAAQIVARTGRDSFAAVDARRSRRGEVAFDPSRDRRGPVGVIGAVENEGGGRLVVVGDADFASDGFVSLLGNKDLFLSLVGWLARRPAGGLGGREEAPGLGPVSPVVVTEGLARTIVWSAVVAQPALVFATGLWVVLRRRRRR